MESNMPPKIEFIEAEENEWPRCPHCQKELRQIHYKKKGWLLTFAIYWCPHCRAVLGTSKTFNG
jgi:hypothetical protein